MSSVSLGDIGRSDPTGASLGDSAARERSVRTTSSAPLLGGDWAASGGGTAGFGAGAAALAPLPARAGSAALPAPFLAGATPPGLKRLLFWKEGPILVSGAALPS